MDLNNLPVFETLTGNELVPVQQAGIWGLIPLYVVLNTSAGTITSAPTAFTATAISDSQIDLSWSGSGSNYVLEYNRDNDGAWAQIYSGATASFSHTLLYPEETYYYRVKQQAPPNFDSGWVLTNETTPGLP